MPHGGWLVRRPRWIEDSVLRALTPVARPLVRTRVHPHVITTVGFLAAASAAAAFYAGEVRLGGALLLAGGILDALDGAVARRLGLVSVFGSFYDSTLDRMSEIVVFIGILALFLPAPGAPGSPLMVYVVAAALGGSLMVSYTRARAEALGLDCSVGLAQRPERVVLLGLSALLFGWMWEGMVLKGALVAVAILANLTTLQRILWVYRQTRNPSALAGGGGEASPVGAGATDETKP